MGGHPSIAWVLLAITCLVAVSMLNPRIRRQWHWGRTRTRVSTSTFGSLAFLGALGMTTATAFGLLPFPFIFLSLPLMLVGALYDSWRDNQATRKKKSGG